MKFLPTPPPVPPYLFVGSAVVSWPADPRSQRQLVAATWGKLATQIAGDDHLFEAVLHRLDQRATDPGYTDRLHDVFYTALTSARSDGSLNDAGPTDARLAYYL